MVTTYSLLGGTPFNASDFTSSSDGQQATKDVSVQVDVDVYSGTSGGGTLLGSDTAGPAQYTVTVTNTGASVTASGNANTSGAPLAA